MSKQSTSRLTPPWKTRVRRRAAQPDLEWLDAIEECCRLIETLAGLLEACRDELMDPGAVHSAGGLIRDQAGRLRGLVWPDEAKGDKR